MFVCELLLVFSRGRLFGRLFVAMLIFWHDCVCVCLFPIVFVWCARVHVRDWLLSHVYVLMCLFACVFVCIVLCVRSCVHC